jgi:predicted DNA-binding ribbon-helix-helix protein
MKSKSVEDDDHKQSIRFEKKDMIELQKIASLRNISVSEVVREYVKKGLVITSYKEDTDFIREVVREELRDVLEPQINRIVKMLMKIGKVAAGTMYSNLNVIHQITDQDQQEFYDMVNRSLRLGVEYMKKKDMEIDTYLSKTDDIVKESEKL